jgi:hypothetical protein
VVVDVPSLEQIQVYLLSQTHMLPLTVLATAVERKSKNICDFNGQYSPLHIMRLPLRQVCTLPLPFLPFSPLSFRLTDSASSHSLT